MPIYQKHVRLFCRLFRGYTGLFRERCRALLREIQGLHMHVCLSFEMCVCAYIVAVSYSELQ